MSVSLKNMPERVERDKPEPVKATPSQATPKKVSAPKPPVKPTKPTTVPAPAKKKKKPATPPASNVQPPVIVSVRLIKDDKSICLAEKLTIKDYKLFLHDIKEVLEKHVALSAKSKKTK
jgi:hypothetical protein